jgi:hypothetical protein
MRIFNLFMIPLRKIRLRAFVRDINNESNEQMWFLTETITNAKDNRRYIPVYELGRSLSPTACQILPVAHASVILLVPLFTWW